LDPFSTSLGSFFGSSSHSRAMTFPFGTSLSPLSPSRQYPSCMRASSRILYVWCSTLDTTFPHCAILSARSFFDSRRLPPTVTFIVRTRLRLRRMIPLTRSYSFAPPTCTSRACNLATVHLHPLTPPGVFHSPCIRPWLCMTRHGLLLYLVWIRASYDSP